MSPRSWAISCPSVPMPGRPSTGRRRRSARSTHCSRTGRSGRWSRATPARAGHRRGDSRRWCRARPATGRGRHRAPARGPAGRASGQRRRARGLLSRSDRRSSATSPGKVNGRATSVKGRACGNGSTTSRNGDGCSSSLRTAVTTRRRRARVTATWKSRVSSCAPGRGPPAGHRRDVPPPVTRSTRLVDPAASRAGRVGRRPPRPATTTRSHLEAGAGRRCHQRHRLPPALAPRGCTPATSCPATWLQEVGGRSPAASRRSGRGVDRASTSMVAVRSRRHGRRRALRRARGRRARWRSTSATAPPRPPRRRAGRRPRPRAPGGRGGQHGLGTDPVQREGFQRRLGQRRVTLGGPAVVELEPPQRAPQPPQPHQASAPPTGEVSTSTTSAGSSWSATTSSRHPRAG